MSLLAVIPARGGSKGLPGKNIRPLAGHPLIAHSILMARMCPEIDRLIVSTDDEKIAAVAKQYGADVPFFRPAALAQDETPMWPVVRHALQTVEEKSSARFDYLLLLDPTSPGRFPQDIAQAFARLKNSPEADGIVGVSQPEFSPIWHTVVEKSGWMSDLFENGASFGRRQDTPTVYRINASLYIWRTAFIRRCNGNWRREGNHLLHEIPESRAIHIDELFEFQKTECLIKEGLVKLPWLK